MRSADTALVVIDVQYHGSHREHGLLKERIAQGEGDAIEYFASRIETMVVPNIRRLQDAFRATRTEVIHVRTQSLTADGRDRSLAEKLHGTHVPPGSREADILEDIAPAEDEIVLSKSCAGVFNGTNIEYLLRNLGIANLVITGVVTGSCVELAVRDASDRGFRVTLVEDATATWTPEMQQSAIDGMRGRSATIKTTVEVIDAMHSADRSSQVAAGGS